MKTVQAKVITRQNGLALIEWMDAGDSPKRAWVTPDMILDGDAERITVQHPEGGIPYGVDWSTFISTHVDVGEIERRLRQSGLWTVEDLMRQPKVAQGVLYQIAGDMLQMLLHNARAYQKEGRE